jgi:hypothetical protein
LVVDRVGEVAMRSMIPPDSASLLLFFPFMVIAADLPRVLTSEGAGEAFRGEVFGEYLPLEPERRPPKSVPEESAFLGM